MPYDSSGVATVNRQIAVTGQTVLAIQVNTPFADIESMLSQVLLRSGAAPLSGNLPAAGFKITGAADGSADQDYVTMAQLNEVIASVLLAKEPTGSVKGFRRTSAPTGWVKENGGTIGNAASGGTTRANADTEDLFTLLWGQFSNTILPIQDSAGAASTRGASAAADFAANKRMPLFDSRSRFHRGADDGLGFDAALTVGATQADGIKNHVHPGTTDNKTTNLNGFTDIGGAQTGGGGSRVASSGGGANVPVTPHNHDFTTDNNTGGIALETRPRSSVLLYCIKL